MLPSKHLRLTFTNLTLSALVASCGINRKPHYDDKNFGQSFPSDDADLPVTSEPSDPDQPPSEPSEPEPEVPTDTILSHYGFSGYFDLDSVRRIVRGNDDLNGELSQGGLVDSLLSKFLGFIVGDDSRESLSMLVQQNGLSKNKVIQEAETGGGDSIANFKGSDSQSGTQIIDWAVIRAPQDIECPTPFVCVERMVWIPKSGQTMTYCYRDHDTKKPIAIPYSPNSQFGGDAFASAIGTGIMSKPFEVVTHPGNVACDDETVETRDVELVVYKIYTGSLVDQRREGFLRRAVHRGLQADTEIVIEFSLFDGINGRPYLPKSGPFIDQRTRLASKMRFFLNSAEHLMVKLERTVQSPLKIEGSQIADAIRDTYGSAAAYLVERLFPKDNDTEGVQLTYSFEFCTHLGVVRNPFNHCTGR